MTATLAPHTARWAPALDRDTAMRLAATEYDRFTDQLRRLDGADWSRSTACPAWDVRAMAAHTLGMAQMVSGLRHFVRQNVLAARAGGGVDALTALQVRDHGHRPPEELVRQLAGIGPRAVRSRRRLSRMIGRLPFPEDPVIGGRREQWTFAFLFDTVLTRDPWMHRMDIALATGREPELTADHDGRIVADVVAEWSERHGQPYRLHLTGPAGGTWTTGHGGPELELDAVEFCRLLSGRGAADGLLAEQVPF
jgi:uncharacterized protein (TIGR03083 family)